MYAITEYGASKITSFHFWVGKVHHKEPPTPEAYQDFKKNILQGEKVIITANGEIYATRCTPGYCDGEKAVLSIHETPPQNINIGVCPARVAEGKAAFCVDHSHGKKFFRTRSGAEVYAKYLKIQ